MACEFGATIVHGYLDGELDAVRAADFEMHLETCPNCTAALDVQDKLSSSIQNAALYERAPASLRASVISRLPATAQKATPARRAGTASAWLAAAAIAILVLFAAFRFLPQLNQRGEDTQFAAQVVDAHLRSLQPGHLIDVISTDQHTVKPWFNGKLDFSPPVQDLASDGFDLQGGRLDVVAGRTVAALVYGRRKHLISVFIWPTQQPDSSPQTGSQQGYRWIRWDKGGMEFYAVSDVSAADLQQLQSLLNK